MSLIRTLLTFILLFLALAAAATGSTSDPAQALLAQARLWQSLNHRDEAQQALAKLHQLAALSPAVQAEALALQAMLQLQNQQLQPASQTLKQLKQQYPHSAVIHKVEQLQRVLGSQHAQLLQARALARSGKTDAAIAVLDALYQGPPPDGELALEYWSLVVRSPNKGWQRAHAGLSKLQQATPDNRSYQLALADLYLYQPPAPPTIFATLQTLTLYPDSRKSALKTWRRALLQLEQHAQPNWFNAYLREVPDDSSVAQHRDRLAAQAARQRALLADPGYRARLAASKQLDNNQLAAAERSLEQAQVHYGQEADVLGNWGRLRAKQGQYQQAIAFYRQAQRQDKQNRQWSQALVDSYFEQQLAQAARAIEANNFKRAEQHLQQAAKLRPHAIELTLSRAQLAEAQQQLALAWRDYHDVLTRAPANAQALAGLIRLYLQQGEASQASAYLDNLPKQQRHLLGSAYPAAQASIARQQAEQLLASGQRALAIKALQQAVALQAQDPWNRLALAKAWLADGQAAKGEAVLQALLNTPQADSNTRYAYALFQSSQEQNQAALLTLEHIPTTERSDSMAQLQRQLWLRETLRLASAENAHGQPQAAQQRLQHASQRFADDPAQLSELASGWLQLGPREPALALMQKVYQQHPDKEYTLRYARLLLDAQQSTALLALLAQWDHQQAAPLTPAQQSELTAIYSGLALLKASAARQQGQDEQARELLDQALIADPQQADLLRERAELDISQQQWQRAEQRLQLALQYKPQDDEAKLLLLDSYRQTGQWAARQQLAQTLLNERPLRSLDYRLRVLNRLSEQDDPQLSTQALDTMQQQGESSPALFGLQAERALKQQQADSALKHYRHSFSPTSGLSQQPLVSNSMLPGQAALASEVPAIGQPPNSQTALQTVSSESQQLADLHASYAALLDKRTGTVQGGLDWSFRGGSTGTPGQSQLAMWQAPLLLQIPGPANGQYFLRSDYTSLDAKSLQSSDSYAIQRFGAILACRDQVACAKQAGQQQSHGQSIGAGFANDDWRVDLGHTPLAFPVSYFVGGLKHFGKINQLNYSIDIAQRPLTSSLLSYAGTRDPYTGETWGGVRSRSLSTGLGYDQGEALGVWSNLGYQQLTGENVARNRRLSMMGGVYWRIHKDDTHRLTVGINNINFWYQKNLSEFTLGQGGYYSPQAYHSLSVPISYALRNERWSTLFRFAPSLSYARENSTPFYPTRPDLQQQTGNPQFSSSSGPGKGVSASTAFEYQLNPRLVLGGQLEYQYSPLYQPGHAQLYLRYSLAPAAQTLPFPVEPLVPYTSF
ncbi:cellulose synthase subunit BcsC-related outer membrane protein [Neisseriaceae bacterium TC5R-5]|nr:cellulose synthase subunit BcsC-related outer membrane protein [Neisseriaceae bacterium TC5R-5]